jgi:beta-galactosidase
MKTTLYPATVNSPVRNLFRRQVALGGAWSLRLDPDGQGAQAGWAESLEPFEYAIEVPGCVQALESLAAAYPSLTMPNAYEAGCWYRRVFELPPDWQAARTWLLFGGVMPSATVWLNGVCLGSHSLSPVAVKFEATDALWPGLNVLTVELPWRDVDLRGGLKFGPGLWRTVELEGTSEVHTEDLFIRPRVEKRCALITASLFNGGAAPRRVSVRAVARPHSRPGAVFEGAEVPLELPAGGSAPVELTLDMPGAPLWSPEAPFLHVLTLEVREAGELKDAVAERFGLREMTVGRDCLLLNGDPLMFRAVCDEFFGCPTLAPIVDPVLIRRRIEVLKSLGFNAKRYHTHVPPREELDLCDELGLLVHAEISVISNFNNTNPYPASREVWCAALRQMRSHAAFVTYCMGNEGSQIMDGLYDKVREYYADARALAPDTPILAASGMQGEHPDVPNDYETPHFWGRCFKSAYDGLTATPWFALEPLAAKGPLVIHEYGKFTVWPDPEEDAFFREAGMPLKGNYGAMGRIALEEAGLSDLLPRAIRNSRALAAVCNKIALEDARRLPRVTGYHLLSAFRLNGNRGMVDDLARRIDPEAAEFIHVNAPTALVLDRGFQGRTVVTGQTVNVTLHLSHFGPIPIEEGRLSWSVTRSGGVVVSEGVVDGFAFPRGCNGPLTGVTFRVPDTTGQLTFSAELRAGGRTLATNRWDFWAFAWPDGHGPARLLCDVEARGVDLDLMAACMGIRRLDDAVSMRRGDRICKTPTDHDALDYLAACPPAAVVADRWTAALAAYVEAGGSALLFDTGHFPADWYAPRLTSDKAYGADIEYDIFTLFAPFRAGWDHGNAATVISPHPVLAGFPHEGFCDLQWFTMIQGARALRTAELPGSVAPIVRVIPLWMRRGPQAGPSPENPDIARPYETENRVYLAECRVGKGRLLVSSLRHFADPAGRWLLDGLLWNASGKVGA